MDLENFDLQALSQMMGKTIVMTYSLYHKGRKQLLLETFFTTLIFYFHCLVEIVL